MARIVRPEQYAAKRAEILNAAQLLMFSKGYERMSIQDILEEVRISSGAFHHYFASRGALLEAFIEQVKEESGKPLRQLIDDPKLSAREKFQGFFDTLDRRNCWARSSGKAFRKAVLSSLIRTIQGKSLWPCYKQWETGMLNYCSP